MIDLQVRYTTNLPMNPNHLLSSLFTLLLISTGCGGGTNSSPNELREELRERAHEATQVNYKKPLGRKKNT